MPFELVYTKRARRDLENLNLSVQRKIVEESLGLKETPFPSGKKRKKIQGMNFPCYRLRIDTKADSFRLFYGIDRNMIYVLRIVSRKEADRIISSLRKSHFPPPSTC